MEKKFEQMIEDFINGNLSDFRTALRRLSRRDLLAFCLYCSQEDGFVSEALSLAEINKQFNI